MDYYIDGDKPLKEPHETVSHKTMFLLVGATAIIVIILILIVLSSSQINSKASLSLGDQDNIKFSGSLITNGELVDTFASNGEKGRITLNKNNNGRIVLKSNGLNNIGFGNGRIIIRDKYGNIVGEFDDGAYFDENGNLVLDWDWDDFNFDGGDDYEEFDFWVEFYDEDSNSELILNIPLDIIFIKKNIVNDISPNCPPCDTEECETYEGDGGFVLELPANSCRSLGIKIGDRVDYQ